MRVCSYTTVVGRSSVLVQLDPSLGVSLGGSTGSEDLTFCLIFPSPFC